MKAKYILIGARYIKNPRAGEFKSMRELKEWFVESMWGGSDRLKKMTTSDFLKNPSARDNSHIILPFSKKAIKELSERNLI